MFADPEVAEIFLGVCLTRNSWLDARRALEKSGQGSGFWSRKRKSFFSRFFWKLIEIPFRISVLDQYCRKRAVNVGLSQVEIQSESLPKEFDGFRIIHMSDFHFELIPEIVDPLTKLLRTLPADIAVLTGDYQDDPALSPDVVAPMFSELMTSLSGVDRTFAILGNHDSTSSVDMLTAHGAEVLLNEVAYVERGDARISITGLDDVFWFYNPRAMAILRQDKKLFQVLAVHSPDLYLPAAQLGYNLYLAGHTHGGQVCLPGGIPIMTHMGNHRHVSKGRWQQGEMVGYTTNGVGVSSIPLRVNCDPEVVLITLKAVTR